VAQGSIRKHVRDGGVRHEVVVDLGKDPVTSKRCQRTKTFETKKEARHTSRPGVSRSTGA
jgi:hypothetical protein